MVGLRTLVQSMKVEISKFTHLFVTCRVSDGSLALHGANELVPPATEAELSKRLALEGHSALASIVEEVSVAVGRQELKGLLRTSGYGGASGSRYPRWQVMESHSTLCRTGRYRRLSFP
jgi:hypothetical protein